LFSIADQHGTAAVIRKRNHGLSQLGLVRVMRQIMVAFQFTWAMANGRISPALSAPSLPSALPFRQMKADGEAPRGGEIT
jgi:hypothetical protein